MANIFSMNWAPLDVSPLKTTFDELFVYLKSLKELSNQDLTTIFEQAVEERLVSIQAQLESGHQELDLPVVAQSKTFVALDRLRDSINKTWLVLVDQEQQYIFQQQRLEEQLQACQYHFSIIEKESKDFEALRKECLMAYWLQQDKALLVKKYAVAKQDMVRERMNGFNAKCQAFFEN